MELHCLLNYYCISHVALGEKPVGDRQLVPKHVFLPRKPRPKHHTPSAVEIMHALLEKWLFQTNLQIYANPFELIYFTFTYERGFSFFSL